MNKLINIKQASEILGVSKDTLRRWDKSGKLRSLRIERGKYTYRYYFKDEIIQHLNICKISKDWATSNVPESPMKYFYCQNATEFNGRLSKFESQLLNRPEFKNSFSLLVSIAGEIGNNSFDHNIGNWPDIPGVFFAYNLDKRLIVLADRGQGILKTLVRAKPDLKTHKDALKVAFTEFITGRIPEIRGNGLKLVRRIISKNKYNLIFQTGNASVNLKGKDDNLNIKETSDFIQGCFALIKF